jgi:hypothetical protein
MDYSEFFMPTEIMPNIFAGIGEGHIELHEIPAGDRGTVSISALSLKVGVMVMVMKSRNWLQLARLILTLLWPLRMHWCAVWSGYGRCSAFLLGILVTPIG